ncbi:iron-dicitrate ABC transporter substrate-binding protein [Paenibacillus sp. BIHB 4019]|uniref:Iron-dicitrate ABC transporter substrate-binding protein n=1 Tax=Paenibacillus sp. BIHB 4019 TaxID=1870819 RepID=A0A1B2DKA5_9BACL|nr:ABC transporter substrate-binding protein [Paenibacillus sp. BIHB 4019]ANY68111.1 iron-dicitrate ABC transporter substrate-binding protein [Paenibacillus sp. BIHB 4019]
MKFSKSAVYSVFLLTMIILIVGCSNNVSTATPDGTSSGSAQNAAATLQPDQRTIKHDMGETAIQGEPVNVVVLEVSFIDPLLDAGIVPIGVAEDGDPNLIVADVLEKIKGYTSVGMRAQPSLEAIRALKPDLIIAETSRHKDVYKELSNIAPTLSFSNTNGGYEDVISIAASIGDALGKSAEMTKVIEEHQSKLKAVQDKASEVKDSILLIGNTDGEITVRTADFFSSQLMSKIGLTYALSQNAKYSAVTGISVKMSIEQLLEVDPDIIILMSGKVDKIDSTGTRPIFKDELWNDLKAVKTNQMYDVDRFGWSLRRSIQGANVMLEQMETDILKLK